MICVTGDLHHQSLGTENQRHSDRPEIRCAQDALHLFEQAGVKVTFFVSGLAFAEEWDRLEPVATHPLVAMGGHNWNCLSPTWLHRVSGKVLGSYNGPAWYQDLDVRLTQEACRRRTGREIQVWRNHMYMHGPHTDRVLASRGIVLCSDGVDRTATGPRWHPAGLWHFPLNVMPDHEHLYHAERTREWVARWQRRYRWSDDFGPDSYDPPEWTDRVLQQLADHEDRGVISCMILHPITMYLADRYESLKRIVRYLATRRTAWITEALPPAREEAP